MSGMQTEGRCGVSEESSQDEVNKEQLASDDTARRKRLVAMTSELIAEIVSGLNARSEKRGMYAKTAKKS